MPITAGGAALASARQAAEEAVRARWRARGQVLTASDHVQLRLELKQADSEAIIAYMVANALVTVVGPGGTSTGGIA